MEQTPVPVVTVEAHLMADGSAASRALGVKEGEAVDDAVVAKKIAAKEVEALPVNGDPVATRAASSACPCLPSPHHPPSISCSYSQLPFPHE